MAAPRHRDAWLALSPDPNLVVGIPPDRFPPREPTVAETLPGYEVTITGGGRPHVDDPEILRTELEHAGVPQDRLGEAIIETVTHKVSHRELDRLSKANPAYAEIIGRYRRTVDTPWRATVKR